MKRSRLQLLLLTAVLTLGLAASAARACPMCSENLPAASDKKMGGMGDDPSTAQAPALAEGFYYSIVLMLVVPYTMLAGGGVGLYYLLRKSTPRVPVAA